MYVFVEIFELLSIHPLIWSPGMSFWKGFMSNETNQKSQIVSLCKIGGKHVSVPFHLKRGYRRNYLDTVNSMK